jgi:hypothetical protein
MSKSVLGPKIYLSRRFMRPVEILIELNADKIPLNHRSIKEIQRFMTTESFRTTPVWADSDVPLIAVIEAMVTFSI